MFPVIRMVAGFIAALVVALVLLVAVEFFSGVVYPTPPDFDGSMEQMCAHVAAYPHWILAVAVLAWGLTAFLSTLTAQRIGGRVVAIPIGLLLFAALVFNISMLPYPIWFKVVSVLVIPLASVLGTCLSGSRKSKATKEHR